MTSKERMPVGVFVSIGSGLGASVDAVRELGVQSIQLHKPPDELCTQEAGRKLADSLEAEGMAISVVFCGYPGERYDSIPIVRQTVGLVPDDTRQERLRITRQAAEFAASVGAPAIGMHVGFVSDDWDSPDFTGLVSAVQGVCEFCSSLGLAVHLETGQESSETLLHFIEQVGRPNLFVNFDPANMILYGSGEPLAALVEVGKYVRSCHCKDAVWSDRPGEEWGKEVPLGEGDVDVEAFLRTLSGLGYEGPLTIEREIPGQQQIEDIRRAIGLLNSLKSKLGLT